MDLAGCIQGADVIVVESVELSELHPFCAYQRRVVLDVILQSCENCGRFPKPIFIFISLAPQGWGQYESLPTNTVSVFPRH